LDVVGVMVVCVIGAVISMVGAGARTGPLPPTTASSAASFNSAEFSLVFVFSSLMSLAPFSSENCHLTE
jgi:hypothetical protein